jgi:hypothetical protein
MATLNFKFLSNTKGLNDGIRSSKKALGGFESSAKKISNNIGRALGGLGLALGATALVSGLKDAAKAASDEAKQQRLLALQLQTTTNATDEQIASAESFIDKLSRASGELDDNLRPALSNAVRATGSLSKGQELLEIALDGARASGKPLDTVLQALLKANNGNTTALYKLAPQLRRTKGGLDDYAASVKGAAAISADPFARMQVAVENVQEKLGAIFLPLVEKFANYIIEVAAPAIEDFLAKINDPDSDEGKMFIRLKDLAQGLWDMIVKIASSKEFQKMLERLLAVAEDLLLVLEDIGNIEGIVDETVGQILGTTIASSPFATPERIVELMKEDGVKFTIAQAKRALKDPIGGADGEERTPWPMAKGGIVMPRPGGTLARIGEAGRPEAVIPLDRFGGLGSNTYVININKANVTGNEIVAAIQRYERGTGRRYLANG